jgi:hypothetical protein
MGKGNPNRNIKSQNPLERWVDPESKMLTAVVEVLDKASDEKLAEAEAQITADFSDAEKSFISNWPEDYSVSFNKAREKIEKKGKKVDDASALAIRQSFIGEKKKWGFDRQISPEKADLLEKYLELKLPTSISEKKQDEVETEQPSGDNQSTVDPVKGSSGRPTTDKKKEIDDKYRKLMNPDIASEKAEKEKLEFTPEQQIEIDDFCAAVEEIRAEKVKSGALNVNNFVWEIQIAFRTMLKEDYIPENIFSADQENNVLKVVLEKIKEKMKS